MRRFPRSIFIIITALILACIAFAADHNQGPRILKYDVNAKDYVPLLSGPPDSIKMKSGYVILEPGKKVGKHSTESNEEIVIVLEGQGNLLCSDGSKLEIMPGKAVYSPPNTEHDVVNTGKGMLRYIYVVSNAK